MTPQQASEVKDWKDDEQVVRAAVVDVALFHEGNRTTLESASLGYMCASFNTHIGRAEAHVWKKARRQHPTVQAFDKAHNPAFKQEMGSAEERVRAVHPHAWRDETNDSIWSGVSMDGRVGRWGSLLGAQGWDSAAANLPAVPEAPQPDWVSFASKPLTQEEKAIAEQPGVIEQLSAPQPSPEAGEEPCKLCKGSGEYQGDVCTGEPSLHLSGSKLPERPATTFLRGTNVGRDWNSYDDVIEAQLEAAQSREQVLQHKLFAPDGWLNRELRRIGVVGETDMSHEAEPYLLRNERAESLEVAIEAAQKRVVELEGDKAELRAAYDDATQCLVRTQSAYEEDHAKLTAELASLKASQGQDEWVIVEERLPEREKYVIAAYTSTGGRVDVNEAQLDEHGEWVWGSPIDDQGTIYEQIGALVTHWRPLPSPPSTRENGGGE